MTMNGQRMSKTLGTIIDPIEAADRLGADPLRLYLVKEIAFGGDGDFSWSATTSATTSTSRTTSETSSAACRPWRHATATAG
jgi:methionyl-tRNA synthetase